jgi:nucleoside 2-deoxyribosyltransferase
MKVYIAGPFFNAAQLENIIKVETVLDFNGIAFYSPRSEGVLSAMTPEEQKANFKRIFDLNIQHMDDCTHMVACVEHKDTGTIFEMGYFCAQKKPIVMYSEVLNTVNVMLGQSAYAIADSFREIPNAIYGNYSAEIKSWT